VAAAPPPGPARPPTFRTAPPTAATAPPSGDRGRRGPFPAIDRPRVEVRHEDAAWYPGRLHGWVLRDGAWWAVASYETRPGIQFYVCVHARDVRPAAGGP